MSYFNRFDIAQAYYCYAYDYNDNTDRIYKIHKKLRNLRVKPSFNTCYANLPENAKEIYDKLVDIYENNMEV